MTRRGGPRSGFGLPQCVQEFDGTLRGREPIPDIVAAHQPGDPAQGLDVRTGGGLGADQQEEQPYRLAVERVELNRHGCQSGRHPQFGYGGRLAVRNRNAVPDAGRQNRFPFAHGTQHFGFVDAPVRGDHVDELSQQRFLVLGAQGDPDPLRTQQFREEHTSRGSWGFRELRNPANLAAVGRLFNRWHRAALTCVVLSLSSFAPASAQRLLDLPIRVWAGADAIATGAAAVFWNPAAAAALPRRGEVTIVDVLAPRPTGLGGFAAAGVVQIDSRTAMAAGYQHVGVEGILQTDDSPLAEDAAPLDLGENGLVLAVSRSVLDRVHAGALVRYIRAAEIVEDRSVVEFGAGVFARPDLPGRPVVGAAVRTEAGGAAWMLGAKATPFGTPETDWRAGASWGIDGGPLRIGVSHRLAALAEWREYVTVSLGVAGEPDADGRTWRPMAAATLRLARYSLDVMREHMANDFGAIHSFRFTVGF